jgi:hypothetical protein
MRQHSKASERDSGIGGNYQCAILNLGHLVNALAEATNSLAMTHWSLEDYVTAVVKSTADSGCSSRVESIILSTQQIKNASGEFVNSEYAMSRLSVCLFNLKMNIVMEIDRFNLWSGVLGIHHWKFQRFDASGAIHLEHADGGQRPHGDDRTGSTRATGRQISF